MQCTTTILLLLAAAAGNCGAEAVTIKALTNSSSSDETSANPIPRVVTMLRKIKADCELNAKYNQQLFDRYGAWVERMLKEKTELVEQETKDIADMKEDILKLEASKGKSTVVVKNTKQDIADNEEATKDAEEMRTKERAEYEATKTENENAKGALAAAVKVLAGTGTGALLQSSKSFRTRQEVRVLSIVNRLYFAVNRGLQNGFVSDDDLQTLKGFLQRPTDVVGTGKRSLSAAQVGQNPFGDYAPRSDRIQGILQQMLADFSADIVKNDDEEGEAVKAYEKLMETRKQELETLEKSLEAEELSLATSKEELADTRMLLDETKQDLKGDQQIIEDVKKDAVKKSKEYNDMVRFSSQEIAGINEAVDILLDARGTFTKSYTTFLQISSASGMESRSGHMFKRLKQLATRGHSMRLAKIALKFKSGWHFDKVIASLDDMLKVLREEEASDIAHKDRCESSQNANKQSMEDLTAEIEKTELALKSLGTSTQETSEQIKALQDEITNIQQDMIEQLKERNKERVVFEKANEDDTEAVIVLEKAMAALAKIQPKLLQVSADPVYAVDPDEAPKTEFKSSKDTLYAQSNVIAILEMCKEDVEKDMRTTMEEEKAAEEEYDKITEEQTSEVKNLNKRVATLMGKKADLDSKTSDAEAHKTMKQSDLANEDTLKGDLADDCLWVKKTFDDRYKKRKDEMAAITEAKQFLAGA